MAGDARDKILRAARDVVAAFTLPGPHPEHHRREVERVQAHWPVLARRLSRLAGEVAHYDASAAWARGEAAQPTQATVHVPPARRLDRGDPR